jgi:hypothetical protein
MIAGTIIGGDPSDDTISSAWLVSSGSRCVGGSNDQNLWMSLGEAA